MDNEEIIGILKRQQKFDGVRVESVENIGFSTGEFVIFGWKCGDLSGRCSAVVYPDGKCFFPDGWTGKCPMTVDEIAGYEWYDYGRDMPGTIMCGVPISF